MRAVKNVYKLIKGKKSVFSPELKADFKKKNLSLLNEKAKDSLLAPSFFRGELWGVKTIKTRRNGAIKKEDVALIKTNSGKEVELTENEFDALCYLSAGLAPGFIEKKVNFSKRKISSLKNIYNDLPAPVKKKFAEMGRILKSSEIEKAKADASFHTNFFRGKNF